MKKILDNTCGIFTITYLCANSLMYEEFSDVEIAQQFMGIACTISFRKLISKI